MGSFKPVGGWRREAGGWRLEAGGQRLAGQGGTDVRMYGLTHVFYRTLSSSRPLPKRVIGL